MAKPHTPAVKTGQTLAQALQQWREQRGITQAKMAEEANLELSLIQDLENGIILFVSPAQRQKLARALKIRPSAIKLLEHLPAGTQVPKPKSLSTEGRDRYIEEILHFPNEQHPCPVCSAPLVVRIFSRKDLEDHSLMEVKAYCSKCLFKL